MAHAEIEAQAKAAVEAARLMAWASPEAKNNFLQCLADLLPERESELLKANAVDLDAARVAGMDAARLDRLRLTGAIIAEMRQACLELLALPDPIGATESQWQRPNGLLVGRMRVPLGVIAMIYEARPNVTVDAAILCIKAGNAVILRGGSEALNSNLALGALVREALASAGLPKDAAQIIASPGHDAVLSLCKLDEYIDLLIPRGGESLIRAVSKAATMPVLKHDKGVCHIYLDQGADLEQALEIIANAKAQRPGVCNALECLLLHSAEAKAFLPLLARRMNQCKVEIRASAEALPLLAEAERLKPLCADDLGQEFHDLILAVQLVEDMDEALALIAAHGSKHTEVILTRDQGRATSFLRRADASMVGLNVSTRFNDGAQLGLGAEIGISTSKLHAYGPMGVRELTTSKFVVLGNGQIRA